MTPFCLILAAVLLDAWLGEPRRWHPLVGFGRIADGLARGLNRAAWPFAWRRIGGVVALLLVLLPAYLWWRYPLPGAWQWAVEILALYLALGGKSLAEHALAVRDALAGNDLALARERVGCMVSRDTAELDAAGVAKAAVESTLENGNDAVFGALFWFVLLGGPGALAFRLVNTLDAMWGYKTERLHAFGWAAARFDDLLNFVPARLTALSYAVLGNTRGAWQCWRSQAGQWSSPNAGPVMAAGAGALNVRLGGAARYRGEIEQRPELGRGDAPQAAHIAQAVALMRRGMLLWLAAAALWTVARHA